MRAFIVTTFIGCFGVDENNKIITFKPFLKNPEKIAEKLKRSEKEKIEEERAVEKELKKKKIKEIKKIRENEYIKNNLRKLALDYKFVKDQIEFNQLLTKVNIELTKVKIKKAIERDALVIQCNGAIEELDKSINILVERLREFYGLHFPEMDRVITDHEKFAKIVENFGSRERITDPELKQLAQKSMGADLKEEDIRTIQSFAARILELYKLREDLSKYLDKLLKEVAPNFRELAGPTLAARLIAKAGGLQKLARMPSSTLQLLGAERALFRHLRGRGKSPRFGILFNHPLIQNAPEKLKGRVARVLASKLSIAVKMDYYSREYKGDELKKELKERVKGILKLK